MKNKHGLTGKVNNPAGKPVGKYGVRTAHTLKIPDKLWEAIPGNKSKFIIELLAEKLNQQQ